MKQKQELKQIKINTEKDTISPPKQIVDAYEKGNTKRHMD